MNADPRRTKVPETLAYAPQMWIDQEKQTLNQGGAAQTGTVDFLRQAMENYWRGFSKQLESERKVLQIKVQCRRGGEVSSFY